MGVESGGPAKTGEVHQKISDQQHLISSQTSGISSNLLKMQIPKPKDSNATEQK